MNDLAARSSRQPVTEILRSARNRLRLFFGLFAASACRTLPDSSMVRAARRLLRIQLTVDEIRQVLHEVRSRPRPGFLVFGVGNDTPLWAASNPAGQTLFLENDSVWAERVKVLTPMAQVVLVEYPSRRSDWQLYLQEPPPSVLRLPSEVESRRWDVILVDAPAGFSDHTPGRMLSIAAARHLAAPAASVFIHDCDREIEAIFADNHFSDAVLQRPSGRLRHYKVP